ncbi:hypothetical protein H0H81_008104 [Sphagnurus paluster]|uniref:Integral membrane protein n=1 Tax=Sphagnurus paluster TaxID=117069 RepID=A0A9P7FQF3_9AGAR|nr:hypothetical protein H0H81_008104 [Sphagnurus paluster]
MRSNVRLLILVGVFAYFVASVHASALFMRDGSHHHNPHAAPLVHLNETEISMYHAPTPESYYTIDFEGAGEGARHPGLIMAHIIFMSLAFFVALPVGIAMRSVNHAARSVPVFLFYALCALGCASSGLYRKLTPNMYEGAVHTKQGYLVLLLALALSAVDILALLRRIIVFFRTDKKISANAFWSTAILGAHANHDRFSSEYSGLVAEDPEEFDEAKLSISSVRQSEELDPMSEYSGDTAQWANNVHHHSRHYRNQSTASDGTVFGTTSPMRSFDKIHDVKDTVSSRVWLFHWIGKGFFAVLERFLVFAGFSQTLLGIVIYTGGCRENYINGCLAHLIKGGIFWSYGLISFARFLGSFAELGWAWNRPPNTNSVSAEFTESLVIFIYGATNMWMERFGANAGDPFTTKQIQHIGIAVMFCFAGLIDAVMEPTSYSASFNPFPALVIGVTGAAMAAHAQTYLFQVQIHTLWGNLLVAFAVLRCLTYFFLWLGPPKSILPSRPPTEALGSFFLACGGLVFMFSTEEVTIAAMRRGRDGTPLKMLPYMLLDNIPVF